MKTHITYFLILLIVNICQIKSELLQVIEIFRHGARGPIYKYYDYDKQKYYKGELTEAGMRQHFELGRALRKEYIDNQKFLSSSFNHSEFRVFSTNVNRTIRSAQSQLLGLYPQGSGPEILDVDNELKESPYKDSQSNFVGTGALPNNFQVFPIRTVRSQELFLSNYCPKKDEIVQENYQKYDAQYKQMQQKMKNHMDKFSQILSDYSGKEVEINNTDNLWDLFDNMYSNTFQERQLPKELTEQVFRDLQYTASFEWMVQYGTGRFNKLISTEFLKYVTGEFDKKVHDTNNTVKFIMLSAHDTNIVKILGALKLTTVECIIDKFEGKEVKQQCLDIPTYASQLIFELHRENGRIYVKLKYQGQYVKICEGLDKCELSHFKESIQDVLVENPYKECGFIEVEDEMCEDLITLEQQEEKKSEIFDVIIVLEAMGIFVLGILMYYKNQQMKEMKVYLQQQRSEFQS